ncbi:MAG TPA: LuxR family transcriptional regulator, partial [Micromonosporaceae bacterium]|nr:LuxR family transcriptional regulator [Micromonosporaceae bacterium]
MPTARGSSPTAAAAHQPYRPGGPPLPVVAAAVTALATPGLVVLTGGPGAGRSTALRRVGESYRGPVFAGGGLAMLAGVPALALARAVRARLPTDDAALLAEAVRSRVRGGLLLLDDLQWADPATLAALPQIAAHCRVAVALRTPHRIPGDLAGALHTAATVWLPLPPLTGQEAVELARRVAPRLTETAITDLVRRAGGLPLAVEALARHASVELPSLDPAPPPTDTPEVSTVDGPVDVRYAIAGALADLPRPARTAMAALGLLGRPVPAELLGDGAGELIATGLVQLDGAGQAAAQSPYVAEVAAGLLDPAERVALHRRLAQLVPPREAAQHLAAAGDAAGAYRAAVAAAGAAQTAGERGELLLFACALPGVPVPAEVRRDAARLALAAGRPRAALRALDSASDSGPAGAVLRGEALLQVGDPVAAGTAVQDVPDDADPAVVAARDRVSLLALLATDPAAAQLAAAQFAGTAVNHREKPGLVAAVAAVR